MALVVNDTIQNNSPKALDAKYGIFDTGALRAYTSLSEANATIISGYRSLGLTVLINTGTGNVEYWWKSGLLDSDLVLKTVPGSFSYTVATAGNTANYTVTTSNYIILSDLTGQNNRNLTLPSAPTGSILIIQNLNDSSVSTFSWSFTTVVKDYGLNTVAGVPDLTVIQLVYNGTNWQIIN